MIQLGGGMPALAASGQIYVSTFVTPDTVNKYCVIQAAGPAVPPIAVSQQGTWQAPGVFSSIYTVATNPSVSGTNPCGIALYGISTICRLALSPNANAITPGQFLCADPNGYGIDIGNASLSGYEVKYAGAIALTSGSANQFIRVLVIAPFPIADAPQGSIYLSLLPTTVPPQATIDETFTVIGLPGSTQAAVTVSGYNLPTNIGIVNARILSAGSLSIRFINPTTASIVPTSSFFAIGWLS